MKKLQEIIKKNIDKYQVLFNKKEHETFLSFQFFTAYVFLCKGAVNLCLSIKCSG